MANRKFSEIAGGVAVAVTGTDQALAVRAGADVLVTPVALDTAQTWTAAQTFQTILVSADNTFDIGASGATRPRTGYFGTSLVVGTSSAGGSITAPASASGAGNDLTVQCSNAGSGNTIGGSLRVVTGLKSGSGGNSFFAVQQPGGTPGTSELQLYHNGTAHIKNANTGAIVFENANYTIGAFDFTNGLTLGGGWTFGWTATGLTYVVGGTPDTYFARVAAGVTGTGATMFIQNTGGEAVLASAFTDAVGTLTVTNLSRTLVAGRSYRIEGYLIVSNTTATDGSQFDFAGGACTATTFDAAFSNVGSVAGGTQTSSSLAGVLNYTTNTGTDRIIVRGYIKVGTGGTITLRAATNTHVAGTMTLAAGSWLAFYDTVPL